MEAAGLAFSVAQTLFAALQSSELKQLFSMFGYKSELEDLERTVKTIKSVLLDVDSKGVLNQQEQDFVDKLSNALYDADDLLDEFATVAAQEMQGRGQGRVPKKVRSLFSRFDKLGVAYSMSREVKKIRKMLDGIADDAMKLSFKVDYLPIRQRREETCSYVYQPNIIGREDDTNKIIDMLLDPNCEGYIVAPPVITIVGMGGMGKTALAQLVYNDPRVAKEFPLRLWTCVADEGQSQLYVESILGSILRLATDGNDALSKEQIQNKLRKKLHGNKYLLVLDDVWTEKRDEWLNLVEFFMGSEMGSRIVVTTRSKGTAIAVGSGTKLTYELQGLSDDNSWCLFEVTVGKEQANHTDFVDVGRAVVKKCVNVPLAIKVIGSLLYGQDENKWRSFQNRKLFDIEFDQNGIMQILKFSYHNLSLPLKSCFSYCALFSKDFIIKKKLLIRLWMAQGYVEPLHGGQSIEDIAEDYFLILLRRCFFQDVKKNKYGEIESCKIHDLMHDVAQEVARKKICLENFTSMKVLDKNIRHISYCPNYCNKSFFTKTKMRTHLLSVHNYRNSYRNVLPFPVGAVLANMMCLRALDLSALGIQNLPKTIGELLHLRYLDLSSNNLEVLPETITKLYNLQTLDLYRCSRLKGLPKDLSKLINLRILDITDCKSLTYMPSSMKKLTCLSKLPIFIVGGTSSCPKQCVGEMEDLGALRKLKGKLKIQFNKYYSHVKETRGEGGGYLSDKEHLNSIVIKWESVEENERRVREHVEVLEDLQPHRNLRALKLINYHGERIPRWARGDNLETFLPNLVKIKIVRCEGLKELLRLSRLRCLKSFKLIRLNNLEYIENNNYINNRSCGVSSTIHGAASATTEENESLFCPSLEKLSLVGLPKLKGWWRDSSSPNTQVTAEVPFLPFPCLSDLCIVGCPNLTSIPHCRTLESLCLDKKLGEGEGSSLSSSSSHPLSLSLRHPKLRKLQVRDVGILKSMPIAVLHCLIDLFIFDDPLERFSGVEEVFLSCSSSSLRNLWLYRCDNLKSLSGGGLEHLTALEKVILQKLPNLRFDEEDSMPWRSLRRLELYKLDKMVSLPKVFRHLTSLETLIIWRCPLKGLPEWIGSGCFSSLQFLHIINCKNLESLPEAMRNLISLRKLEIGGCSPVLEKRCRSPDGEDWPKIRHIPTFELGLDDYPDSDPVQTGRPCS